jgi:two-component system cell cycle response regulator CtrA
VLPVAAIHSTEILSGADQVLAALSDKIRLFARLQLILRQSRGLSRSVLRMGPLIFDFDKREITANGKRIRLSDSLYSVLELLAIHHGRLVTRDMLAERLYGQVDGPSPKVIDIFICKLRQRLARLGADNLIHTVWGRGYVMRDQDDANTEAEMIVRDKGKPAAQSCAGFR